jgi:hypothetical protein
VESNLQHPPASRIAIVHGDVVIAACAISAGAHAALVRSHMQHEPKLGLAFVLATVLLLAVGAAVALSARAPRATRAAALLFAGLIALYVVATTVGIPLLSPEPEPVDGVALTTKAVESAGLVFALKLNKP